MVRSSFALLFVVVTGCTLLGDADDIELRSPDDMGSVDVGDVGVDVVETPDLSSPGDTAVEDLAMSACPEADLMADEENCGDCGVRCLSSCDAGQCDAYIVADAQSFPRGIDVDGTHVYWANENPGEVWKASLRGGEPELLAADETSPLGFNPRFLHVTTTDVITSVENSGSLNHGAPLFRVPKSGGGVATGFARPIADGTEDFVIVGSTVYSAFQRSNLINVSPLNQDSIEPLVDTPGVRSVAHANNRIFFGGSAGLGHVNLATDVVTMLHETTINSVGQVVSNGAEVFVATGSTIYAVDDMGGNLRELVTGLFGANRLAVVGDRIFFLSGVGTDSGSVFSMTRNGDELIEHVSAISFPREIVVDDSQVYCTAGGAAMGGQPGRGTGYVLRAGY